MRRQKEQHLRLLPEELREDYCRGLLPAVTYLYYLIRALRRNGWRLRITSVDSFCQEWKLARSSFYRAKAKLIELGLVQEAILGPLELWVEDNKGDPEGDGDPWVKGGEIDPGFWAFVQEKTRKLPTAPVCPEAVTRKLIKEHGQELWKEWQKGEKVRQLRERQQEEEEEELNLDTPEGRLQWLENLWSSPFTRWVARKWIDENPGSGFGYSEDKLWMTSPDLQDF